LRLFLAPGARRIGVANVSGDILIIKRSSGATEFTLRGGPLQLIFGGFEASVWSLSIFMTMRLSGSRGVKMELYKGYVIEKRL